MVRPCFLIFDRETSSAISTRKLVVETAKFNVITAYSSQEVIDILDRYPALDLVVTDSGIPDMGCDDLIKALKSKKADLPVLVVLTPRGSACDLADYTLDTFEPKQLLSLLQRLFPADTAAIRAREQELEDGYFRS